MKDIKKIEHSNQGKRYSIFISVYNNVLFHNKFFNY